MFQTYLLPFSGDMLKGLQMQGQEGDRFWPLRHLRNVARESFLTSSSAVAKRPFDALCLLVVSFNLRNVKRRLLLLIT